MSTQAMGTLCEILENGSGLFRLAAYSEADIDVLRRAGLVVQDGVVSSVLCDNCDHGHPAEVRRGEGALWGYTCPEAGFIEVSPHDVAAGQICMEALLNQIGTALNVSRRAKADISGRILPIGNFWLGELNSFAWLAMRHSSPEDYAALHSEIRRRPFPEFGAVLTTAEAAVSPFPLPGDHYLIPLREVAWLVPDGQFSLNLTALHAYAPKSEGTAPGRKSGEEATWRVIEHLLEKDVFPSGQNQRARAIRAAWPDVWPNCPAPARSTLFSHFTKLDGRLTEMAKQHGR